MARKAVAARKVAEDRISSQRDIPTLVKDSSLVEERRAELVRAAVGLFIRKGYHQTTTREIAREAGVSIGSLYEYIKTKEDVLYLVCEAIHREMEERLGAGGRSRADYDDDKDNDDNQLRAESASSAASTPSMKSISSIASGRQTRAELEIAIRNYFEVCDEMQDSILLIYRETASLARESQGYVLRNEARIAGLFAEILERGVTEGSYAFEDARALELMAHNIVVMGHMWALRRWALRDRFSLAEYTKEQTSLILGEIAG